MQFMLEGPTRTEYDLADLLQDEELNRSKQFVRILLQLNMIQLVGTTVRHNRKASIMVPSYAPTHVITKVSA